MTEFPTPHVSCIEMINYTIIIKSLSISRSTYGQKVIDWLLMEKESMENMLSMKVDFKSVGIKDKTALLLAVSCHKQSTDIYVLFITIIYFNWNWFRNINPG